MSSSVASGRVAAAAGISVPALDASGPYSSRLSARSALFTELVLLLSASGTDPLPRAGYRSLVVDANCLAKPSTASRGKLWEELRARYVLDGNDALFQAFWAEWRRSESDGERALTAYVLFALRDRLVSDLAIDHLHPLLRSAPAELSVDNVLAFLRRAEPLHPEVRGWSDQTRSAVAQKYLASIRDFGLARGVVRKVTVRPALYGSPVRLLVRSLRLVKMPEIQVVQARVFRLLALEAPEVIDALGELNRSGAVRFRMQGDVVELGIEGER